MIVNNKNTSETDGMMDLSTEMELVVSIIEVAEIESVCNHEKKGPGVRFPMYFHHH